MKKDKLLATAGVAVLGFGVATSIACSVSNAQTDEFLKEVDAFIAEYEAKETVETHPLFTAEEGLIAKVTGFEVGFCCDVCKYYVASACINRMNDWYDGDPIAMVTDNNGLYYMMNPDYVDAIEVNDWNYYDHANEMIEVVKEAKERTADIWFWDCADTQREWAEVVYYCPKDGMWYYK